MRDEELGKKEVTDEEVADFKAETAGAGISGVGWKGWWTGGGRGKRICWRR